MYKKQKRDLHKKNPKDLQINQAIKRQKMNLWILNHHPHKLTAIKNKLNKIPIFYRVIN